MYHKHLEQYTHNLYSWERVFLQDRTRLSLKEFPQGKPNLNTTVEAFFDDAVTKIYSHDWLHELYAYEDKPMYTKMQRDSSEAWCEKDMWNNFSLEQKLQTVAEETYVISTERFIVPSQYVYSPKLAYFKSLEKVCTTLCSGWFRDFAIDNYPAIIQMFDEKKVQSTVQLVLQYGDDHRA